MSAHEPSLGKDGPGREVTVEPLRIPVPVPLPKPAPPPSTPAAPEKVPARR